jgi:hypothetical protein
MGPQPQMFDVMPGVECDGTDFLEFLKDKRESLFAVVDAGARLLEQLLPERVHSELEEMRIAARTAVTVELTLSIEGLEESAKHPGPGMGDRQAEQLPEVLSQLATATLDCETLQRNRDNLERHLEKLPEEMAAIVEAGILPMILMQLSAAERNRDMLQKFADQIGQAAAPDLALGAGAEETAP